ncbi:hypothetical protein BDK51DRAFT_40725 [Blyttiomyces helicus]|uniref:Uncharacterized protein n=1 Tax=Blyttiomyces helicus TaxID=388810 RepID=A0A4P9WEL7_9FUNG|nr:hypothetical protein BDK51DRAFT_40725 [Blyttiomyces helicus]|eukprot:RKO89718.1 hypothetical protein BDK51DRAFT_40725 [Blyttiomyces helicus]
MDRTKRRLVTSPMHSSFYMAGTRGGGADVVDDCVFGGSFRARAYPVIFATPNSTPFSGSHCVSAQGCHLQGLSQELARPSSDESQQPLVSKHNLVIGLLRKRERNRRSKVASPSFSFSSNSIMFLAIFSFCAIGVSVRTGVIDGGTPRAVYEPSDGERPVSSSQTRHCPFRTRYALQNPSARLHPSRTIAGTSHMLEDGIRTFYLTALILLG